jgi:hypothetical protein
MQVGAGSCARTRDIARIGRDFRMDEHNMEWHGEPP